MYYECETCDDAFYTRYDCEEHMDDEQHWPECETCDRVFQTLGASHQHMNAIDHWAKNYECGTCTDTFRFQSQCDQHMTAYGHWPECETCTKCFRTQKACIQHMNATNHWAPKHECETCTRKFHTRSAALEHMRALKHWENYCKSCDRQFSNANNFRAHMNSRIHRGQKTICPFCQKHYTTATGLIHHLERGGCSKAKSTDRQTIWRMIRELDPEGKITKRDVEWVDRELGSYHATDRAFNGYHWECYLCHRKFGQMNSLNAHLNSAAHYQDIYHCPSLKSRCGKEFSTLAALFNHLEGESCGFMRFEQVQQRVDGIIRGGLLGF